eukprot:scaffold107012_cov20-Tisochrysis_lutea.AAC.1
MGWACSFANSPVLVPHAHSHCLSIYFYGRSNCCGKHSEFEQTFLFLLLNKGKKRGDLQGQDRAQTIHLMPLKLPHGTVQTEKISSVSTMRA